MWDALFTGHAIWFSVPALIATALFVVKLGLVLIGGHADGGLDTHDGALDHVPDASEAAIKLLSVQGILAFAMGFGWGGLGLLAGTDWKLPGVFAMAILAGIVMMYIMGAVMASMLQLQSSGNIDINAAIGWEGTVYASIPGESAGSGQVVVVVDQRQRTYDAITAGTELPRNTRVRIVGISGANTLNVIPV